MEEIKTCPFCGASATIEEHNANFGVVFSVGCNSDIEPECMGYQSLTMFNTRAEAIAAWNRRAQT